MVPQHAPHISRAVFAYVSATSLSLLFCLSKGQAFVQPVSPDAAVGAPGWTADDQEQQSARGLPGIESGLMSILESLLQTQLGVFVFSNFVIACCTAVAAVTTSVFLESLTPSEAGRLTQRLLKYLLFKVVLVGMVVLPSEVRLLHWLPWLAIIGEMKMFVGLAKDRLAGLSVTPTVGLSRHVRTLCLLGFILCSNALGLALLHRHQGALSWAISLLFALDLGIISVEATKAALSCASLLMDEAVAVSSPALHLPSTLSGRAMGLWDGWQGKRREKFFYTTELLADVAVHLLTLLHHMHVWLLHGMSFHLLDAVLLLDTRMVVMSFVHRVKAHMLHRAATHSLDFTFPDATEKHLLAEDADCAVCRDSLAAGAKQLPCGHLFHLPCLRAWLQQSGHDNFKCPICRRALCVQRSGGLDGTGRGPVGVASAQQQQRWRVGGPGGPGLMGNLSLSMSYNDLSAAAGGVRQVSLEEQLLRGGFSDDAVLGDAATAQLLAAASVGSSDTEGFDALLAQALAASLQTAHAAATAGTQQGSEEEEQLQGAGVVAAARPGGVQRMSPTETEYESIAAALASAGDEVSSFAGEQQGLDPSADASCDVAGSSGRDQHSCSDSSSACTRHKMQQITSRASRTASLPVELLSVGCRQGARRMGGCGSDCGIGGMRGSLQQQGGKDGGDSTGWSDPLSDSDCAPHGIQGGCSSSWMPSLASSTHRKQSGPNPPAAVQASSLPRSQRYSRSCSHLPDLSAAVGACSSSWAPAAGCDAAPGVAAGAARASTADQQRGSDVALLAIEQLLTQPRDPLKRRQGGRWGRRRVVANAEQQGGGSHQRDG